MPRVASSRPTAPGLRRFRRVMVGIALATSTALAMLTPSSLLAQQRNPGQLIGATVADRSSADYRFERFVVTSADGNRRWRVNLGIPRGKAPAGGFPAIWMLDGNAALVEFDDTLLQELAHTSPSLLVFVGYDNELRIDSPARTRDYTPFVDEGEEGAPTGGGANAFLEVLERQIRPEVARRAALDASHQTLWGHSLGGLFVLHALYTRSGAFQIYAAASPSLWWKQGAMLGAAEQQFVTNNAGHRARLLLTLGSAERMPDQRNRDLSDPRVQAHLKRIAGAPSGAAAALATRLQSVSGVDTEYTEFEGLGHGPMFRASLMHTLHRVAGIGDRSAEPRP